MSSLKQNIRSVLADVETFLVETLKSVKLNSSAKDHKDRLLEKIRQVLDDIPGSAGSFADSNASGGSLKISGGGDSGSGGTSSSNLQTLGDEDPNYSSNITKVAVADLKNKLQSGMLEKKKKSGFKSWEPFYCVVNGNIFYLYKKQGDSKQKEAFCLNGYEFQEAPGIEKDASRKETCFELVQAGEPTYQFRAGSKDGMLIWREAITKGIQIAAEEAPGENYDDLVTDPRYDHHYGGLGETYNDVEEELYDDLDSFQSPQLPVSRQNSIPQRNKPHAGDDHYINLSPNTQTPAEQKSKTEVLKGAKVRGNLPPKIDIFKEINSEVTKETPETTSPRPVSVGIASQGQPAWKKGNTLPNNRVSASVENSVNKNTTANQGDPKSPPVNPNKGRNLPPVPSNLSPKSGQVEKEGRKSPSPPASDDSTPAEAPSVKNLMKMFQK